MQLWMCERTSNHSGGNGKRDPPVLIPNTEVKPLNAGSTWLDTAREIMKPPDITKRTWKLCFQVLFPCIATAYSGTYASLPRRVHAVTYKEDAPTRPLAERLPKHHSPRSLLSFALECSGDALEQESPSSCSKRSDFVSHVVENVKTYILYR